MKVKCKKITSEGFDFEEVKTVQRNDFDYRYGGSGLQLGEEYLVMGMMIYHWCNCLYYLVDVNSHIDLFPYLLFDISDNTIPGNWYVRVKSKEEDRNFKYITGFYELCTEDFLYNLLDGNPDNQYIYFKRKIGLEKYYEDLEYLK